MADNGSDLQAAPPGRHRWLMPALLLSIALNLVVVGLVVGALWRVDGPGRARDGGPPLAAFGRPYIAALPQEDRHALRALLRSDLRPDLPDRAARRALYDAVIASLRADPFDAEALARAAGEQARVSVAFQQSAQAAWVRYVSGMSPSERLAYAAAVEDVLERGRHDRGRDGRQDDR